ncbi:unnamed protein product [Notodromas monacha]|uniref:ubiquitinyl hydrolase 1 n=1 Tax=Notodromas monacha TaxID=399045 RepID=A0A7R9GDU1_9CRUS|nr:unnamed protein product [Notodromas monacha]CAG0917225.1 unnamed protein product [Notodromas monacha]
MAIDDFAIELKSYQETEVEADQTIDTVDLSITDPEPTETTSGSPSISDAGSGVPHEQISPDRLDHMDEDDDVVPSFPLEELDRLDDMIARIRWVVPVLPRGELEVLLLACIDLAKRGVDHKCEPCQKFIREGLTLSFQRILTDEAVSGWKYDIHRAIQRNCERLVDLCVVKVVHDSYPLLDLLAMVFNPSTKFQLVNSSRTSETLNASTQGGNQSIQALQDLDNFYALPPDLRTPRGWLVDIINRFGAKGGFQALTLRFNREDNLSVPLIFALLRPFGLASEFLTPNTIRRFFMPLVERIPTYLENLTDDELKKEAKLNVDIKNDALSSIVKWLRAFVLRLPPYPEQEETAKNLEIFRLKMILRLLEISSFNGKMNALNELNKAIASISYTHSRHSVDDDEWLTTERMARWIEENRVLQIILRDSLHQPQYVEKLEKIIRFSIKEKAMTTDDLDTIWAAQIGKHEAIVKNVHDLLAKLAWDFSPEQLDHLFECFQASWSHANQKQREKLLELIRRLAEDDKEGVMATKVLSLLWNLAHSEDLPTEIMDQALQAHRAILDYSCSQDRDSQKTVWLERCVAEVKEGRWVIPTLKQIREICRLYEESFTHTANYGSVNSGSAGMGPHHHIQGGSSGLYPGQHSSKGPQSAPRHEVITHLHNSHSLVVEVANNLEKYMSEAREYLKGESREGQLWLAEPQAQKIWRCLAQEGIFSSDREACFKWFSKLMGDEPDLDPEINRSFFETVILQFDPTLLTESGMKCFERFFKSVNAKEQKLILKRRNYQMNDYDLIGMDYIWRVIHNSGEEIANRAIELLREIHTNLGPKLQAQQVQLHEDFITSCMDRLRALYDTISILMTSDKDHESDVASKEKLTMEVVRVCRVLKVLYEYIVHCDYDYPVDRVFLPLARAYRGKAVTLTTRFQSQSRGTEDIEIWSHTNDSLGSVRRQIISRLKAQPAHTRVELYLGGEILERTDDRKLISQIPIRDKAHLTGKIVSAMPSSPDSSSDSSGAGGAGSPQHSVSGVVPGEMEPNLSAEKALPGYRMSQKREWTEFLFKLWDLGAALGNSVLRNSACGVLRLIPPDESIKEELVTACAEIAAKKEARSNVISGGHESLEEFYFGRSPSQVLYYLEVTYALLIPAAIMLRPVTELAEKFQRDFVRAGGVSVICRLLTDPNFMVEANYEVDGSALKAAFQTVTRLAKLLFTTVVHGLLSLKLPLEETRSPRKMEKLRQALSFIPNPTYDVFIRQVARELGEQMPVETSRVIPDEKVVYALIKLSWCAAYGRVECFKTATAETMKNFQREYQLRVTEAVELQRDQVDDDDQGQHNSFDSLSSRAPVIVGADQDDLYLCREALETLTVALAVCPENLDKLIYENEIWPSFVIDMLLLAPMKFVRIAVAEQMSLMAMRCCSEDALVKFIQPTLFSVLHTSTVTHHDGISHEYFNAIAKLITDMFYSENSSPNEINDWEFALPVGPRSSKGFVGLKNAGATCYMNSVMQQLFMVEPVRQGILSAEGAIVDPDEDFSGEDMRSDSIGPVVSLESPQVSEDLQSPHRGQNQMTEYNIGILKQIQAIFGHLAASRLQYYIPRGLWKQFRINGEPVNLREQHDAVEFYNSLVESLDEALKTLGHEQVMSRVLGGSYADQIICRGCPHRYSREAGFTVLIIDIRNHSNIYDSLENYVKGELLEGANAYYCEKCDKKVDTVKRMCIKKLPRVLTIQLKRFDYDWERESPVKFNDYFEFSRELDMEPYTVRGLAKLDGDVMQDEDDLIEETEGGGDRRASSDTSRYKLTGIVVHSGQASGGHYYSYILHGSNPAAAKWHQQLNLHNLQYQSHYQSVAGRHFSESGLGDDMDSICRPFSDMTLNECSPGFPKMPAPIERSVKLANMRFAHNLNQFQPEYFVFMKRLLSCNLYVPISMPQNQVGHEGMPLVSFIKRIAKPDEMEEAMLTTTVLGCKFLIRVGFRTKKSTRGNANDWQDILSTALKHSRRAREFLAYNVLLSPMLTRKAVMCEFLLECSTQEVRSAFGKLIAALAHACLVIDGSQVIHIAKKPIESSSSEIGSPEDFAAVPLTGEMTNTFLLKACLSMLDKEVPEHGRNLSQYFGLFHHYAMLGTKDKLQLLKLDVPRLFMQIATDEGPGQPIKYQFADLGKLFSTVSLLVRSCDVSSHCQSAPNSKTVKPLDNEYAEGEPVMQVPPSIVELLYSKQQYVKKIIEDAHASDDTLRLLQFASWENASFSSLVLGELLWQIAYSYSCELRPFLDLLFAMLTIKDTWQTHRIHNVLKGVGEEREGLLDTIQRSQSHFQKRAYMCIKWLVSLFEKCTIAFEMLNSVGDFKRKWNSVINWLHKELEGRPPYAGGQYSYAAWSPPAQSNETSTAYYVERSASARLLLEKAMTLCPEDEPDTEEQSEEPASDTPLIGGAPAEDEEDVEEEEEDERRPQFSFTVITSKKERLTPALFKEQKHFNYSLTDSTPLPSTLPHSAVLSPVLPFNNNNNNADNNNAPARFSQTGRGEELVETDRPEVRNIPINVESPDGSKWLMKGVLFTDPPPSPTEQEPPNK